MKRYRAEDGYRYVLDENTVCIELCTPDDFDESRLRLVTADKAEQFERDLESEE